MSAWSLFQNSCCLELEHFEGGDSVVNGVHPDGDPEVSCFFASKSEN